MKNIYRSILLMAIGSLISLSAYSQGSGSTQTESQYQNNGSLRSSSYNRDLDAVKPASFEVTKTVKGNLVKVEKGRISIKTKSGKLLNLKVTYDTKITNKKKGNSGLTNAKLIRVSYLPKKSEKEEYEAVRIKVLN